MIDPTLAREVRPRQGHLEADGTAGTAAAENSSRPIPGPESLDEVLARSAKWISLIGRFIEVISQIDLEKLELRILLRILKESWFHRSKFVWLHEDLILGSLTGIHSQNLGRPLGKLVGYNILLARPRENGGQGFEYRLNPVVKEWQMRRNRSIPRARKTAKYIQRTLGQGDLFVDQRELDKMLEQLSFEEALDGTESPERSLTVSERGPAVRPRKDAQSLTVSETTPPLALIAEQGSAAPDRKTAENPMIQCDTAGESLTVSETPQRAAASSNKQYIKSQQQLAPSPEPSDTFPETPDGALAWLQSVDTSRELGRRGAQEFAREWLTLCVADCCYVLNELRPHLNRAMSRRPVSRPIAFLVKKARDEGRFE